MAKNDKSLNHAIHNEQACEFMAPSPFNDWTVTTAFYSSLHYVLYKMFPSKTKNGEYQTFEDYYYEYCSFMGSAKPVNKHNSICDLVEDNIPKIAADYNKLKDLSWGARYVDYKIDKKLSKEAIRLMKKIKAECACQ